MDPAVMRSLHDALAAYEPGDLLALSDLHDCLTKAVATDPESPLALDLRGCARTIEDQLTGGSYDLDDLFFENIGRILAKDLPPPPPESPPPATVQPPAPPSPAAAEVNPEYIQTFTLELAERMNLAQELILRIEAGNTTADDLNDLFRVFHTVKGEAGFLKLSLVADLFHGLESLLDGLRKATLALSPALIDTLFRGIDIAGRAREDLASGQVDLGRLLPEVSGLREAMTAILGGQKAPPAAAPRAAEVHRAADAPVRLEETLVKVSGAKLSYLVDMIGEMLILQNQTGDDSKEAQMLRKVSREVQQAAMSLRTVNLKGLFTKMKRAVRDVSLQLEKPVTVEVIGEDNEIDRSLVEAVEEPLVHLVRNCIGHGIEDAPTRGTTDKSPVGRVRISAERRGNHVILGIEDDGQGLDTQAILASALASGQVTSAEAASLSEGQIHQLIFLDGLSTAHQVDDISGRGVGMSIVKKTVERFRGTIHIKTKKGVFTRFDLVFPLSMAIIDGMVIELSHEKFIIPVENVLEAVRIGPGMLVEVTDGSRVLRLRGEVVPAVDLTDFFYGTPAATAVGAAVSVIIENNKHDRYAFLVGQVLEKREVVIKSLGHRFRNLEGISAAAILRGGEIGYLVDIDAVTASRRPSPVPGGSS